MPRKRNPDQPPSSRRHRGSGQAVVTLDGRNDYLAAAGLLSDGALVAHRLGLACRCWKHESAPPEPDWWLVMQKEDDAPG